MQEITSAVEKLGKRGVQGKSAALISLVRERGLELPVFVLVRRQRLEEVAVEVMNQVAGYVFLAEETPDFIARNLVSHLRHYAASLQTPFFGRLVDYAEEGNQLWICPGHNGGAMIMYGRLVGSTVIPGPGRICTSR